MSYYNIINQLTGTYNELTNRLNLTLDNSVAPSQELETMKTEVRIELIVAGILGSTALLLAGATAPAITFAGVAILMHHECPIVIHNIYHQQFQFRGTLTQKLIFHVNNQFKTLFNKFL